MGQCNKMLEEMSFNALFQKLPVGIEVYDERGQLVDLNRTDENLFAISRKDIMGINLGNYIQSYSITLVKRCKDLLSHIGRIFPYKNVFLSVSLTQQLTNHEL